MILLAAPNIPLGEEDKENDGKKGRGSIPETRWVTLRDRKRENTRGGTACTATSFLDSEDV